MKTNIFINNIFIILINVTLLLLSLNNFIYLIFLILFLIYIIIKYKKYKYFIIANIILLIYISLHYFIIDNKYKTFINEDKDFRLNSQIIDIEYISDGLRYICRYNNKKIIVYYDKEIFDIGDYVYIIGESQKIEENKIKNSFNYKTYLKHNKINGIIYAKEIRYIKSSFHVNKMKQIVFSYINKYIKDFDSNMMIRALILGDSSSFSDSLNEYLRINGIVHLFAVSGLHITLFITMLAFVLKNLKVKDKYIDIIILLFLFIYIIITSFAPSVLRASLMYFISLLNKKFFNSVLSSLDICSLSFLVLVCINPYIAFNLGFILSYIVCFVLILSSDLIKTENKYLQVIYMSILANIFTLPIVINIAYEINLLSPLINLIFITITSSIILPFSFIVIVMPILSFLYKYIIDLFLLIIRISSYFKIELKLPHFTDFYIIIYYLIILLFLLYFYNKKLRLFFATIYIAFIIVFSNKAYFYNKNTIDCLYLNDGEAMLIRNKRYNVLIDSGDGKNDEVYNFLRSEGIKKLDYFIITHNHNDHNGGARKILNQINVKSLILSNIDQSEYRYYDNVIRANVGDVFLIGDIKFEVLFPYERSNEENDNSLVTLFKFCEYNILCLGDLGKTKENRIISYLEKNHIKIDIIKIGHHGSDTSTSEELIKYSKAKYAIIMVGNKWIEVFPKISIINILNEYNITVFCTKHLYSFKLYLNEKDIYISSVH